MKRLSLYSNTQLICLVLTWLSQHKEMDKIVQYFKNSFRENKVKKYIGVNKIIFELARRKTSVFLHITRKIPHSIVSQNQYFSVRARFNSASLAKQSVPSIANFTPSPPVRQTSGSLTRLNGTQFFPKKLVKLNSKYHICPQEFFFLPTRFSPL